MGARRTVRLVHTNMDVICRCEVMRSQQYHFHCIFLFSRFHSRSRSLSLTLLSQYVLLDFDSPVYVADHSVVIASKLDTDLAAHKYHNGFSCRVAFFGRMVHGFETAPSAASASSYSSSSVSGQVSEPASQATSSSSSVVVASPAAVVVAPSVVVVI